MAREKAQEKPPAFQFYPRDFVGDLDVAAMTLEQAGAYAVLLSYAWLKNGLPNDMPKLARALHVSGKRFDAIWQAIGEKFPLAEDGRLRNPRQERERAGQAGWHDISVAGGKASAEARKAAFGSAAPRTNREPQREPTHEPTVNQPVRIALQPIANTASAPSSALEDPPTPTPDSDPFNRPLPAAAESAAWLLEQFPRWYAELRHGALAPHMGPLDFSIAESLCTDWPDRKHLEAMIRFYLTAENLPAAHANRSLRIFAQSYAHGADAAVRRSAA